MSAPGQEPRLKNAPSPTEQQIPSNDKEVDRALKWSVYGYCTFLLQDILQLLYLSFVLTWSKENSLLRPNF